MFAYVSNSPVNFWDPIGFDQLEYFEPGSKGEAAADSRGKPAATYNASAHGAKNRPAFYDENTGEWKGGKDLAKDIMDDKEDYDKSKPVKLYICYAGSSGLAQDTANALGNKVIANTGKVTAPVSNFGFGNIGWGISWGSGEWKEYTPQK